MQKPGDVYQSANQLKEQEFRRLRHAYKNEAKKFEDWEFPPGLDSLGDVDLVVDKPENASRIIWRRPHYRIPSLDWHWHHGYIKKLVWPELLIEFILKLGETSQELVRAWDSDPSAKPLFFGPNGVCRFDITQGGLGDCWYLSSLAQLACEKKLFYVVVPEDNKTGFDDGEYSGVFHFRYWRAGTWTEVVIDDRLPCVMKDGIPRLIFTTVNNNEFWTVLAEKAFAKLYGSYQQIEGGLQSEALEDFTGGMSIIEGWEEEMETDDFILDMKDKFRKAYRRKALIGVGSKGDDDQVKSEGIAGGHAYSVTAVKELEDNQGKSHFLVRLRNPWGWYEWTGKWCDSDEESWSSVSTDLRVRDTPGADELGGGCDDGEFWISLENIVRKFDQLSICYWSPLAYEGYLSKINHPFWDLKIYKNTWTNAIAMDPYGVKADLVKLPAYTVNLSRCEHDGTDPLLEDSNSAECTMVVALMYLLYNRSGPDETMPDIGFRIFLVPKNHGDKPYDVKFFETSTEITEEIPTSDQMREVNNFFKLEEGTYCIVPFVRCEVPQDGNDPVTLPYLLRIISERKIASSCEA